MAHRFPIATFLFREIEAGSVTAIPPSYCTFLIRIIRIQQCMVGSVVFEGPFSNLKFKVNTTLGRGHCRTPGLPLIWQNQHCPSHQLNWFGTFHPPLSPWISGPITLHCQTYCKNTCISAQLLKGIKQGSMIGQQVYLLNSCLKVLSDALKNLKVFPRLYRSKFSVRSSPEYFLDRFLSGWREV